MFLMITSVIRPAMALPVAMVPVLKQDDPLKAADPLSAKMPVESAAPSVMGALTPTCGFPKALEMNAPVQVPLMEGTSTPESVPESPAAHPVPLTLYLPFRLVAEPFRVAVMVWFVMLAEVMVAVCPLMLPLTGTAVVVAKQVELITRTVPEMTLPDWVTFPPMIKFVPLTEAPAKSQLPEVRVSVGVAPDPPPHPEKAKHKSATATKQVLRMRYSLLGKIEP